MKRAKTKAPALSEYQLHCSVAAYLDRRFPPGGDVWWTTIGHGGGGVVRGARLKKMGVKPGVPDIMLMCAGTVLWIELKSADGDVSPEQRAFFKIMSEQEVDFATCRSLMEVALSLDFAGFPNPHNVRLA